MQGMIDRIDRLGRKLWCIWGLQVVYLLSFHLFWSFIAFGEYEKVYNSILVRVGVLTIGFFWVTVMWWTYEIIEMELIPKWFRFYAFLLAAFPVVQYFLGVVLKLVATPPYVIWVYPFFSIVPLFFLCRRLGAKSAWLKKVSPVDTP